MLRPRRVIQLVGPLVVGFTASAPAQVVRERDAAGQEIRRRCQPAEWPKRLPGLDAVLDSTALAQAVASLPDGDTTSLLFGILYRKDVPPGVRLLEPPGPAPLGLAPLLVVVEDGLRPVDPHRPLAALRIRVRGGPGGGATVERSVFCAPEAVPGSEIGSGMISIELQRGDRMPPPSGRIVIETEISIDANGHVMDARLIRAAGVRDLDDEIVRRELARRYLPALIDDLPIPCVVRNGRPVTRP